MKIINLFEFERPVTQSRFFPFASATWGFCPLGGYDGVLYSILQPEKLNDFFFSLLRSIQIKQGETITEITEKKTYAETVATESTWHYNGVTLFIHFPDGRTPYSYSETDTIQIQAYTGFYTSTGDKELDIFGGLYEPRLLSFPVFREQLDDFATGKQTSAGGTIVLDNSDGGLDNFAFGRDDNGNEVLPKIGWYGRIRQAVVEEETTPTDSDFQITAQGYTTKIQEQTQQGNGYGINIDIRDIRSSLDKDVPMFEIDPDDWGFLSDRDKDSPFLLPQLWGKCFSVPCKCLNETETVIGDTYKFLIADSTNYDIESIDTVYIDGKETALTPSVAYLTQTNGRKVAYFEIASSEFIYMTSPAPAYAYKGMTAVTADISGYEKDGTLIQNALDVVIELIKLTYTETYTSSNYDTTAWDAMTLNAPYIGAYFNRSTALNKIVSDIQKSYPLTVFSIDEEQRYTWKDYEWDDDNIIFEIKPDAFPARYLPSPDVNAQEIGGIIAIEYAQKHSEGDEYTVIQDVSNLDNAQEKYNTDRTYPENYKTLISDASDASDMLARLKDVYIYPKTQLNIKIPMQYKSGSLYAYELRAGDFIRILANGASKALYGYLGCIITEIKQDLQSLTIDINAEIRYNSAWTYKQPTIPYQDYDGTNYVLGYGAFIFGGVK